MDEDEVMRRASQAVREAKKAVAEAEKSLGRTESFLKDNGLTIDQLHAYLERHCGPGIFREIEKMAEQTMHEAKMETDRAINSMRSENKPVSSQRRGFKQFI